jgi:rSAM/selenodomain-associated transferase 1
VGLNGVRLIVMAKAPAAGRSKTRMVPPLTPGQAAEVAAAALADALAAVGRTRGVSRLVALDGRLRSPLPRGFEVIRQRGDGLAERLAAAIEDAGTPAIAISADIPQVTPALLAGAAGALSRPGVDAVLGPCPDGGYWAIGLREFHPQVFRGVPMSRSQTFVAQRTRLQELGLAVDTLPCLRDADSFEDALAIAGEIPGSRFARAVARFYSLNQEVTDRPLGEHEEALPPTGRRIGPADGDFLEP